MKILLSFLMLFTSSAAWPMCYSVFDSSNRLLLRTTKSPVSLSGSIGDAVQQRFPGGSMVIGQENCPPYDASTAEADSRVEAAKVEQFLKRSTLALNSNNSSKETLLERKKKRAQLVESASICMWEDSPCEVSHFEYMLMGFSQSEVIKALGAPENKQSIGGRELWYYFVNLDRKSKRVQISFHAGAHETERHADIVEGVNIF